MTKYIWLTEKMSNSLARQVGEKGNEEGANEGVGEECHVMEWVGGVQQFWDKIWDQIHLLII